jgi:hypothetical protein
MQLTWVPQQNIIENKTIFGNALAYLNIRAAGTPFGAYWIAQEVLLNGQNQSINQPFFTVLSPSKEVIGANFTKVEDAIEFAEKDFAEKLKKLDDQAEGASAPVEETVAVEAEKVE